MCVCVCVCLVCGCDFCWHPLLLYLSMTSALTMQQDCSRGGCQPSPANWAALALLILQPGPGLGPALCSLSYRASSHGPWQAHSLSLPAPYLEMVTFRISFTALMVVGWSLPGGIILGCAFCLDLLFYYQLLLWWLHWWCELSEVNLQQISREKRRASILCPLCPGQGHNANLVFVDELVRMATFVAWYPCNF